MQNKKLLITSIFQIMVGLLAIIAFIILIIKGEDIRRWIITFLLAVAFIILGIVGIIDYKNK